MENLGEYLQQKREEQDISIEELVSRTRIPIRFIEAIETNRLDLLPNQVTAKGFLRSYAECVGVDHALVAEAFSEHAPSESFSDSRARDEILSHVQVEKSNRLPFPRRIIVVVAGLVCALLVLVGVLSKKDKETQVLSSALPPTINAPKNAEVPKISETETVSEGPSLPEAARSEEVVLSGDDEIASETDLSREKPGEAGQEPPSGDADAQLDANLTTDAPDVSEVDVSEVDVSEVDVTEVDVTEVDVTDDAEGSADFLDVSTKEYVLSLEATEASWVQVMIDGEEVREALLQPNDVVEWKANKKFRLTLGNAGGVRVQLDGRELGPFGPSGQVVHKEIVGESPVELN